MDLIDRAATVRIKGRRGKAGHDPRKALEYLAALERETDLSLRDATRWPYTGAQRWHQPSSLKQDPR